MSPFEAMDLSARSCSVCGTDMWFADDDGHVEVHVCPPPGFVVVRVPPGHLFVGERKPRPRCCLRCGQQHPDDVLDWYCGCGWSFTYGIHGDVTAMTDGKGAGLDRRVQDGHLACGIRRPVFV